jgi:hypothetical protein
MRATHSPTVHLVVERWINHEIDSIAARNLLHGQGNPIMSRAYAATPQENAQQLVDDYMAFSAHLFAEHRLREDGGLAPVRAKYPWYEPNSGKPATMDLMLAYSEDDYELHRAMVKVYNWALEQLAP